MTADARMARAAPGARTNRREHHQRPVIALAIEQSSARGSVALLADETVLGERCWEHSRPKNQELIVVLMELLRATSIRFDDVATIAVGLGPGTFSGVRVAVTVAKALALPDGRRVCGVSSGEALAADVAMDQRAKSIFVIGDARRGYAWYNLFTCDTDIPKAAGPWCLHPLDRLAEVLPRESAIVTSEWDRLGERLTEACPPGTGLLRENRYPSARFVGLLAARRIRSRVQSADVSPIYLHAPVFVAPHHPAQNPTP